MVFPLVVVELKNATSEKATIRNAYTQIQNYKKDVPSIFFYNALCVISDGIDAKVSSVSAPFTRFLKLEGTRGGRFTDRPSGHDSSTCLIRGFY